MSGLLRLACLTAILFAIPVALSQSTHAPKLPNGTLQGVVRDTAGNAVSGAHVVLKPQVSGNAISVSTDAAGHFSFEEIAPGTYTLTANLGELRSTVTRVVEPTRPLAVELVLSHSVPQQAETAPVQPGDSMQFADKPDFAVAAVTDWTAAGGHGSDASLRTSEALTREAVKLPSEHELNEDGAKAEWSKQSEQELRAALARHPKDPVANHRLGEFYLHAGRYKEAVDLLQSAYEADPTNLDDELALANALKLSGNPAQAKRHIQTLLSKRDTPDLHRMNAELDESLGDSLGAVHEFQLTASSDPSETNYFAWGSELLVHRAIWQAKEVFDEGARRYPKSTRMLTARAATLFGGALYDDAALALCNASDLDPSSVEPYLFMGKIEAAAPKPLPCVVEKLARFQKINPTNPLANYYFAMALKKQQGSEADPRVTAQVADLLTTAVTTDPKCAIAYVELGNLSAASKQWEQATNYYLRAIRADKDLSDAHYRLAVAYQRMGKQELAKDQFRLHDELAARQAAEIQRQREAVKQFLVVLPHQTGQQSR
jgi:tetratricopeptide (TPR) repeat protein